MARFSNSSGSLYLNVYIDPTGTPDIANNRSNVSWRITVSRTGAYLTYNESGSSTLSVTVDGNRVHNSNPRWRTSGEEMQIASGTTTVNHGPDGQKTVTISATFNPDNGYHGTITTSGNITLPTIHRTSSFTIGACEMGKSTTIRISRANNAFKHTIRYAFGNTNGTLATNVDTTYTWTVPMSLCNEIPSSTSGVGTIWVDTFYNGTKIGERSTQFTATVPSNVVPTFSGITLYDTNSRTRALVPGNSFLQILSLVRVTLNGASGSYGSTIVGYVAEVLNRNISISITEQNGVLPPLNFSGSATIRGYVIDSRGRASAVRDLPISVIEYFSPIFSFVPKRNGGDQRSVSVIQTAKIAPIIVSGTQKNTLTISYKAAKQGSSTFVNDTMSVYRNSTTTNSLTNVPNKLNGVYDINSSYTIIGTISDMFSQGIEFTATVTTEEVVLAYTKNRKVGVGKIPELGPDGSVDIVGKFFSEGSSIQHHQLTQDNGNTINDYYTHFDTHMKSGYYQKASNAPGSPSNRWSILNVMGGDTQLIQMFIDRDPPYDMWVRPRSNSSWRPWRRVTFADESSVIERRGVGMPYGLLADFVRTGNVVTCTIPRVATNIDVFENRIMLEKIPQGYRPVNSAQLVIGANTHSVTKSPSALHFHQNGDIYLTNGTGGYHCYWGTVTYITNDPYP